MTTEAPYSQPLPSFSEHWNPGVRRRLLRQGEQVTTWLGDHNIEPSSALFSGYDPRASKAASGSDEFERGEGRYEYYFGDANSLMPAALTENQELAEDKVMANPLTYAQAEGTVVGVYRAEALAPYVVEKDDEVGTYVVVARPSDVAAALVAEFQINSISN